MTTINPPLLSIVTITRNNLAGLQETARSVMEQSCRNYEWIIIDGDSTDGTKDYLSTLSALSISEPDNGIYNAMNKGLDRARGNYILLLNAGDRLSDPDILSLIESHISEIPSDFIYGDSMEEDGGKFHVKKSRSHDSVSCGMFTHHQAMIYARAVFDDLRFDESYKIAGDYDLTMRFLKKCKTVSYIPAPLCLFQPGGISQKNAVLGRREQFQSKIANNQCGIIKAALVYALQWIGISLRTFSPRFYWLLKRL